jgi:hypothetical protein
LPQRFFRRNAAPGFYNLRFRPSQGIDNNYVPFAGKWYAPGGADKTRTDRNPNNFKFSNNLFSIEADEYRNRASDYVYQIYKRLHRSNDGWTRTLIAYSSFCFMMAHQALFWKVHLFCFGLFTATRIRDRAAEPTIDEVQVLDTIFANEKIKQLFSPTTYHVMDYNQEWDAGRNDELFPEYSTTISKFFNVDCNTTTGFYKMGDVESGAMMTLHFKTMPFANNKFNFTEPFLIYDMYAEITHDGEFHTERIIKSEDVLKTKKIFVSWH